MRATGVGSVPGEDVAEWGRVSLGQLDLPFVPELPERGVHAQMTGRSLALLDGLDADLQPAGWRVGVGSGVDHRRARSLLAQDLDTLEEIGSDHEGPLKQQVAGPWTLAATVELARGEKFLADHGARRDLAESLAIGVTAHVRDLRRRFPRAELVVQVDEPALPAVLDAGIPTASGFGRHRTVHPPEADAHLRLVSDAIRSAGATPVVHVCASDVPVALLRGAGFAGIGFDLALARPHDAWAEAFEAGVELWVGAVPSTDPSPVPTSSVLIGRVDSFLSRLGFDEERADPRVVVSPSCGLAGATPQWARQALALAANVGARH
ncbi:methionine synthase [Aeromicrobium sp. Leaf350]|uniref:methionine synthase n=1 Tax=Aeromicrobium sp. Leaf350 TaxID=2876565 RepID=UPI001E41D486|nr:methionine synthase [Aeromicrobium sp. Leaf350]